MLIRFSATPAPAIRPPEQLEIMQIAGLLVRTAAGFKTAVEELVCRGWSQSQIDEAVHRMVAQRAIYR